MIELSSSTWLVQVTGNRTDLEFLARHFSHGRLRVSPATRGDGFVLGCDDFKPSDSPEEVLKRASELLPVLTGVLRMERGATQALEGHAVIRRHEDGREDVFLYLHDTITVRAQVVAGIVYADNPTESVPVIQPAPRAVSTVALALSDASVAKAYRLLGRGAKNWVDLYRVYEVLEKDMGGQHSVQRLGWVTEDEIRRFKHSANSPAVGGDDARHGAEQHDPPSNPLSLEEAESVVHRLLAAWLEHKLQGVS